MKMEGNKTMDYYIRYLHNVNISCLSRNNYKVYFEHYIYVHTLRSAPIKLFSKSKASGVCNNYFQYVLRDVQSSCAF